MLGVIIDSELCLDKQRCSVVKNSFCQLRTVSRLMPRLSFHNIDKVIQAFIKSQLDYCSSLYLGLPQPLLTGIQMVQNAAARMLTGTT